MLLANDTEPAALNALGAIDFNWVVRLKDVWVDNELDVAEVHAGLRLQFSQKLAEIQLNRDLPIMGWPIIGTGGSGKTHLLGEFRRIAIAGQAAFVLIDMTDVRDIWETVLQGYLDALQQEVGPSGTQQELLLQRLVKRWYREPMERVKSVLAKASPHALREIANRLLESLQRHYRTEVLRHQDVVRAIFCLNSNSLETQSLGYAWLQGQPLDAGLRRELGFYRDAVAPSDILRGLAWYMSLCGPTVVAFDQLDPIVQQIACDQRQNADEMEQVASSSIVKQIGNCLATMRELHATFPIVSCIEATWSMLPEICLTSFLDRFEAPRVLSKATGQATCEIIAKRLSVAYARTQWTPPYSTWPFASSALEQLAHENVRTALKKCRRELDRIRASRSIEEVRAFSASADSKAIARVSSTGDEPLQAKGLAELDERYSALQQQTGIVALLDDSHEDERLAPLYYAAFRCWLHEHEDCLPNDVDAVIDQEFAGGKNAKPLHARLRFVFHNDRGRELHFCVRGLERPHPRAYTSRLRAAITHSGIDRALSFRNLVILRTIPQPTSSVAAQVTDQFTQMGGRFARPTDQDLSVLSALSQMLNENHPRLVAWLQSRRPMASIQVLCDAMLPPALVSELVSGPAERIVSSHQPKLATAPSNNAPKQTPKQTQTPTLEATGEPGTASTQQQSRQSAAAAKEPPVKLPWVAWSIQSATKPHTQQPAETAEISIASKPLELGIRVEKFASSDGLVSMPLKVLAKHALVLGGSGSGKTVTVRRIVEEAALLGIPSIVIDCGKDMCTFDERRAEPSPHWRQGDVERAQQFSERTEMLVWTPGRESGNPLKLELLPDFAPLRDNLEELQQAVEMAAAALSDIAAAGQSRSARIKQGILASSLKFFARRSSTSTLPAYIAMLEEFPDAAGIGVENEAKVARQMSDDLKSAVAQNPLLNSSGIPLDPAVLFGDDARRGRTRISTISLLGLQSLDAQRDFLNQLSMTLFSWIKKHPHPPAGRKLRGLLVIDEARDFVPSQAASACKANLQRLTAQARKYGLGIVFATQHPKDIDTKIVGNCATHFYGRASSPASLQALSELMSGRGSNASDFPRLKTGQFYVHFPDGELEAPAKIQIADCLTAGRLLEEHELQAKAERSRGN